MLAASNYPYLKRRGGLVAATLVFTFCFFGPSARSKSFPTNVSQSKGWLALLRYNKSLLGYKSEADDRRFFVFGFKGKRDPRAELEAFLSQVVRRPVNGEHVRCRFPARYEFLQKHRGVLPPGSEDLSESLCSDLVKFRKRMSVKSVALEFSSFYINKPASAFGHTLLRLSKTKISDEQKFQLLDYGVNYSATVTTKNPFMYGLLGIFGGFWGEFQNLQYYYKVREYNDFQSRDIWSYELDYSQADLNFLVSHIWEMKQARFGYYYFDENCSYHLMALLDAVRPELGLKAGMARIVLPTDTVKVAERSGIVKKVRFRPSNRRVVQGYLKSLSSVQTQVFREIAESEELALGPLDKLEPEERVGVLDALISYVDYKFVDQVLAEEDEITNLKKKILVKRAQTGVRSVPGLIAVPETERPDLSHGTSSVKLGGRVSSLLTDSYQLSGRFALHELIDKSYGLNPYSTMEMGKWGFRFFDKQIYGKTAFLDHFYVFNIVNLNPLNELDQNLSYSISLGYQRGSENGCVYCPVTAAKFSSGPSLEFGPAKVWAMAASRLPYSEDFQAENVRLDLGGSAGLLVGLGEKLKLMSEFTYLWGVTDSLLPNYFFDTNLRWNLTANHGISLSYQKNWLGENISADINWHF